jgi:dipeptidyl aminopeptidase/acylaminoacyl peptidase
MAALYAWAGGDNGAAVGYNPGGVLRIATDSGRVLRIVQLTPKIGDFAISPDGSTVVFTPWGTEYGGPLYIANVAVGKPELLVRRRLFVRGEVYSEPDFSPDGRQVVFAIHGRAKGDLVEASGPFAVVDLTTRKVHVLPSTMNLDSGGVAFANDPRWSPDGKRLLLNFESDAAVADAKGENLMKLSSVVPKTEGRWFHGEGWFGNSCIVYTLGADQRAAQGAPARVLNVRTLKTKAASDLLSVAPQSLIGLDSVSMPIWVRSTADGERIVEGTGSPWRVPLGRDSRAVVQLVHRDNTRAPGECR